MKKIPKTPADRPFDYFNIGDPVVVFVSKGIRKRILNNIFVKGVVVDGYRHHDGCVSVKTHVPVSTGTVLQGRGIIVGIARPEIMHLWEFKYLCQNLDFAKIFVENSSSKGTNKKKFFNSLKNISLI